MNQSEFPAGLVARATNVPCAFAAIVMLRVAEVPAGLTTADVTVIAGGVRIGVNEKVEPMRFAPVIWKFDTGVLAITCLGLTDVICGNGRIRMSPTFVMPPRMAGTLAELPPAASRSGRSSWRSQ